MAEGFDVFRALWAWGFRALLGGSWVVVSRVISTVTILMTRITGLITPLIPTHEPPSRVLSLDFSDVGFSAFQFELWA